MALYDDYFTNDDKPFAENLNDALLLSNVFDMTVPVEFPKMFSNSTWVSTTSPRKCGVAILTLEDGLPSGVSVGTDSTTGGSTLTGTGTVELSFYPNFNSFGKFKAMTWDNTGTVVVNLKTNQGTTIASNISKGEIENQSSELRTLQEIVIEIVMTNATLKTFTVTMQNKDSSNRYGADVGITDVVGLETRLTSIESKDTTQDGRLDIIEAKDVTQDGRLTALEGTASQLFDLIYPIGSIYMSVNSTSPQTLFGGTWERIEDRFLLASGSSYANGSTGGASTVSLTKAQMPRHTHTQNSHSHNMGYRDAYAINGNARGLLQYGASASEGNASTNSVTATNQYTGGTATTQAEQNGSAHENMPPYLAVYVWKRTA